MPVIELHGLQSFPPALLNRDDQGVPKDVILGGVRRDRVSSQCLKRAMRLHFRDAELLPQENLSRRTRTLTAHLITALTDRGHSDTDAELLAVNVVWGMGLLGMDPKNAALRLTNVLLFISDAEIQKIADEIHDAASDLMPECLPVERIWPAADEEGEETPAEPNGDEEGQISLEVTPAAPATKASKTAAKAKAGSKAARKAACPPALQQFGKALLPRLDATRAADIALFGRFMAENNAATVHGAAQVAHAVGVHEQEVTLDYYTAVDDDLQQSGYLDTGYLSAPVLYRYASVDLRTLGASLAGDDQLAEAALRAFATSFIHALPKGKRTSTAPSTRPSVVVAVLRAGQPLSMVDAVRKPVSGDGKTDVMVMAADAFTAQWESNARAYGTADILGTWHLSTLDGEHLARPLPGDALDASTLAAHVAGRALLHLADR